MSKKEETQETKTAKAEPAQNVMYLGPTIAGVAKYSTVYEAGILPDAVEKCIAQFPAMRQLFVPLDGITEAAKKLRAGEGFLSTIYGQVDERFTRKGGK